MTKKPKWPKHLVIVRHGQSELNVARDLMDEGLADTLRQLKNKRDVDIALTDIGKWQASESGLYLAQFPYKFDICFSSPYKRTLDTANLMVSKLPYSVRVFKDNRLREKGFGILHGLTTDDIKAQFPHEYEARKRDGKYWYKLPGGEDYPNVESRVHDMQDKFIRDYSGRNVLVSTHQVPYIMFRALFEHLDEKGVLALGEVPNCGMQEYVIDTSRAQEGRMKLVRYNEVAYDRAAAF